MSKEILGPSRCAQGLRMTRFIIKIQTIVILRSPLGRSQDPFYTIVEDASHTRSNLSLFSEESLTVR